jgi:hypothetical protein
MATRSEVLGNVVDVAAINSLLVAQQGAPSTHGVFEDSSVVKGAMRRVELWVGPHGAKRRVALP